jgi:hypothetical protein
MPGHMGTRTSRIHVPRSHALCGQNHPCPRDRLLSDIRQQSREKTLDPVDPAFDPSLMPADLHPSPGIRILLKQLFNLYLPDRNEWCRNDLRVSVNERRARTKGGQAGSESGRTEFIITARVVTEWVCGKYCFEHSTEHHTKAPPRGRQNEATPDSVHPTPKNARDASMAHRGGQRKCPPTVPQFHSRTFT